jgi:hypothetical protein
MGVALGGIFGWFGQVEVHAIGFLDYLFLLFSSLLFFLPS